MQWMRFLPFLFLKIMRMLKTTNSMWWKSTTTSLHLLNMVALLSNPPASVRSADLLLSTLRTFRGAIAAYFYAESCCACASCFGRWLSRWWVVRCQSKPVQGAFPGLTRARLGQGTQASCEWRVAKGRLSNPAPSLTFRIHWSAGLTAWLVKPWTWPDRHKKQFFVNISRNAVKHFQNLSLLIWYLWVIDLWMDEDTFVPFTHHYSINRTRCRTMVRNTKQYTTIPCNAWHAISHFLSVRIFLRCRLWF